MFPSGISTSQLTWRRNADIYALKKQLLVMKDVAASLPPQLAKCFPFLYSSPICAQALFAYLLSTYVLWSLWSAENIPAFGPKGKILLSNLHSRSLWWYFALPRGFPCSEGKWNIRAQIHLVYLKGKLALLSSSLSPSTKSKTHILKCSRRDDGKYWCLINWLFQTKSSGFFAMSCQFHQHW